MNLPPGPAQQLNIGYEFADPFRAQRVREVLDAKPLHTLDESCKLQCDDLSIPARRICAHLTGLTSTDKDTAFGLSLLQGWDHHLADDSAAALLFEVWWMRHLKPALLDLVSTDPKVRPLLAPATMTTLINWLDELAPVFGAAAAGEATDGPARDARQGRRRTAAGATATTAATWKWSGWHHGYFEHPLANVYPDKLRDVGPLRQGGSAQTVMSNGYRMSDGRAITGASFRMVVDVGQWDNSVFVNAPGQSGDVRSKHYDDHGKLWSERNYVPLIYSEEAIARETELHIVLEPARNARVEGDKPVDVTKLPFDTDAMLAGLKPVGGMREPDLGRLARRRDDGCRRARSRHARRADRADRRPHGLWRLRARELRHRRRVEARHPDHGPSRHGASGRHAGKAAVAARGRQMLRPRHLRHEGRQLHRARSGAAAAARGRRRSTCRSPSCSPPTRRSAARRRAT